LAAVPRQGRQACAGIFAGSLSSNDLPSTHHPKASHCGLGEKAHTFAELPNQIAIVGHM
jgi:hypothetical protein